MILKYKNQSKITKINFLIVNNNHNYLKYQMKLKMINYKNPSYNYNNNKRQNLQVKIPKYLIYNRNKIF